MIQRPWQYSKPTGPVKTGAVDYGDRAGKRQRFALSYRTWEPKHTLQGWLPVPRLEWQTIWADSEAEARTVLGRWMEKSGYALGGIQDVRTVGATEKVPSWTKLTGGR